MRGATILAFLIAAFFVWHATHDDAPPAESAVSIVIPPDTADAIAAPAKAAAAVELPPAAPAAPWGSNVTPVSTAASFVYSKNHPATPLPALAFAAMASTDPMNADEFGPTYNPADAPFDPRPGQLRLLSRGGLCSAIVSVAQANDLPIPFFANLIWQESSFQSKTISSAGALGIAQFIPETAIEHGLMNPFEPIQALFASGKLLRKLHHQFGNLGLAAAAYNAGPGRIYDWMGARRGLPGETRAYVARITGHRADQWLSHQFVREARSDPDAGAGAVPGGGRGGEGAGPFRPRRQPDVGAGGRDGAAATAGPDAHRGLAGQPRRCAEQRQIFSEQAFSKQAVPEENRRGSKPGGAEARGGEAGDGIDIPIEAPIKTRRARRQRDEGPEPATVGAECCKAGDGGGERGGQAHRRGVTP